MTYTTALINALTGLGGVVVGALISWVVQNRLLRKRIEADERLAEKKFAFDKDLAERKFAFDRQQVIQKRHFELAEAILSDSYKLRDLIRYVRNGASSEHEGQTRPAGDRIESDDVKRIRDGYFVPIERLQKQNELIGSFFAKKHSARAHFGAEASEAFDLIWEAITHVNVAATMLIQSEPNSPDKEFQQKMRAQIWGPLTAEKGTDEIGEKVEKAVAVLERICKPALQWKGDQ